MNDGWFEKLLIACTVCFCVAAVMSVPMYATHRYWQWSDAAIEHGYQEVLVPSVYTRVWRKTELKAHDNQKETANGSL